MLLATTVAAFVTGTTALLVWMGDRHDRARAAAFEAHVDTALAVGNDKAVS